jgi:hypothetical protein
LYHFFINAPSRPWYTVPLITLIYAAGFHLVHVLDDRTRADYFQFYEHAKGRTFGTPDEALPVEYWDFRTQARSIFVRWVVTAQATVVASYCLVRWWLDRDTVALSSFFASLLVLILYLAHSFLFTRKLSSVQSVHEQQPIQWSELQAEKFWLKVSVGCARGWFAVMVYACRWLLLAILLVAAASNVLQATLVANH